MTKTTEKNPRGAGRKPIGSGKLNGRRYNIWATAEEGQAIDSKAAEAIEKGLAKNLTDYFLQCATKGL